MAKSGLDAQREEVKVIIRGLLVSNAKAMTADNLHRDYKQQEGRDVPYRAFGFATFLDFLRSIPDTVKVENFCGLGGRSPIVTPVLSKKTAHVNALVQRQKTAPPRAGYRYTMRRSAIAPPIERPMGSPPRQKPASAPIQPSPAFQVQRSAVPPVTQRPAIPSRSPVPPQAPRPSVPFQASRTVTPPLRTATPPLIKRTSIPIPCVLKETIEMLFRNHPENFPQQMGFSEPSYNGYPTRRNPLRELNWQDVHVPYVRWFSGKRVRIPVPHCLQEQIHYLVLSSPKGLPIRDIEQHLQPEVLRFHGIYCSARELLDNLGHVIQIERGWVYPADYYFNGLTGMESGKRDIHNNNFMPLFRKTSSDVNNVITRNQGANSVFNKYNTDQERWGNGTTGKQNYVPGGYENSGEVDWFEVTDKIHEDKENAWKNAWGAYKSRDNSVNCNELPVQETSKQCPPPMNLSSRLKLVRTASHDSAKSSASGSGSSISNTMKENFQTILSQNPGGIWCSQLNSLYKEKFKVNLDYISLGFFSTVDMATSLPEIFHCIRLSSSDWKLYDARKPVPKEEFKKYASNKSVPSDVQNNIQKLLMAYPSGMTIEQLLDRYARKYGSHININDYNFDSIESLLSSLNNTVLHLVERDSGITVYPCAKNPEDENPLPHITDPTKHIQDSYPLEVLGPDDTIPHEQLPSKTRPGSFLEIIVAEVYSPSNFWIQLRGEKTSVALESLMDEMQVFYRGADYKMPEVTIRPGQYCVAPYASEMTRAKIATVFPTKEVKACFIDYGTTAKVPKSDLKFLHRDFAVLPIQGIKASLANIKPRDGAEKWPVEVSQRFLTLVSDKTLIAIVTSCNHETRELEVALVDTTGEDDIHINDLLKHEGFAMYVTDAARKPATPSPVSSPSPPVLSPSPPVAVSPKPERKPERKPEPASATPQQQRIKTELTPTVQPAETAASGRRPPPGFMSTTNKETEPAAKESEKTTPSKTTEFPTLNNFSTLNSDVPLQQHQATASSSNVPPFLNPGLYNNPAINNSMMQYLQQQYLQWQQQQALQSMLQSAAFNPMLAAMQLAASLSASNPLQNLAAAASFPGSSFGGPMVNPSFMYTPTPMGGMGGNVSGIPGIPNISGSNIPTSAATPTQFQNSMFGVPLVNPPLTYSPAQSKIPTKVSSSVPAQETNQKKEEYPPHVNNTNLAPLEVDVSCLSGSSHSAASSAPERRTPKVESSPANTNSPKTVSPTSQEINSSFQSSAVKNVTDALNTPSMTERFSNLGINNATAQCENEKRASVNSIISTDSSVMEQYDIVSKPDEQTDERNNEVTGEESEEVYMSDEDEEPAVVIEGEVQSDEQHESEPEAPVVIVKRIELANKKIHVINFLNGAYFCTDEFVRLFTELSGTHVILKILEYKNVDLPFHVLNRREAPEIFQALARYDVKGLQKSFLTNEIMGKVHLTPLQHVPQLLTILNVQNRDVYRAVQEEIQIYDKNTYWLCD